MARRPENEKRNFGAFRVLRRGQGSAPGSRLFLMHLLILVPSSIHVALSSGSSSFSIRTIRVLRG